MCCDLEEIKNTVGLEMRDARGVWLYSGGKIRELMKQKAEKINNYF